MDSQNRLKDARVVYCSATGASEPRNMGYMSRLGLWGTGTDFSQFSSFLGGSQAQQLLIIVDMHVGGLSTPQSLTCFLPCCFPTLSYIDCRL